MNGTAHPSRALLRAGEFALVAVVLAYSGLVARWLAPSTLAQAIPPFIRADWGFFLANSLRLVLGVGAILLAGWGAGRAPARFIRLAVPVPGRTIPLGLAALGFALLGLGLAGLWHPAILATVLVASVLPALPGLGNHRPALPPVTRTPFLLPVGLALWAAFLMASAPELFQDPLRYHLALPARFTLEHKLVIVTDFFFWSYMGLQHMLYGMNLALGGAPVAANLAFAVLNILALLRISAALGLDPVRRPLVLALALTQPGLMLVTGSSFVEHGWAVFALLALEPLLHPGGSGRGKLRETALFLALALSVKYTALVGVAGCLAVLAFTAEGRRMAGSVRGALARVIGPALAALVPFAAMRWLFTGDPVSPLLARLGAHTMDSSSANALTEYYSFTGMTVARLFHDPLSVLSYPLEFAGAHGGFLEHPGPVIPGLLLLAIASFRGSSPALQKGLLFTAGGLATFLALFGGLSPHYIAGLAPAWALALAGAALASPAGGRRAVAWTLAFCAFYQSLVAAASVVLIRGPRNVAFGVETRDAYLARNLLPRDIHYPIRQELDRIRGDRGTAYCFGDDSSYYLAGRVFNDYESGKDNLLWRLARESADARRLRVRMRQRGITHLIHSTSWPYLRGTEGRVSFNESPRTVIVMQAFWRANASLILARETGDWPAGESTWVYALDGPKGRNAASIQEPILPGAWGITWEGDSMAREGDISGARAAWKRMATRYPGCDMLESRLARRR